MARTSASTWWWRPSVSVSSGLPPWRQTARRPVPSSQFDAGRSRNQAPGERLHAAAQPAARRSGCGGILGPQLPHGTGRKEAGPLQGAAEGRGRQGVHGHLLYPLGQIEVLDHLPQRYLPVESSGLPVMRLLRQEGGRSRRLLAADRGDRGSGMVGTVRLRAVAQDEVSGRKGQPLPAVQAECPGEPRDQRVRAQGDRPYSQFDGFGHVHRVGREERAEISSGRCPLLQEEDIMRLLQKPCGGQSCHARAGDCDTHVFSFAPGRGGAAQQLFAADFQKSAIDSSRSRAWNSASCGSSPRSKPS